jgi:putative DNA primase/helicase
MSSSTALLAEFSPSSFELPEPELLLGEIAPKPFPMNHLPELMRYAVLEVQAYVQAPLSLIAANALGVASLACQGLAKVRRDIQLVSPLSLYLLMVSEPNERKSFSEAFFTEGVREWVKAQRHAAKPKLDAYEAHLAAWHSERKGLLSVIQRLAREGEASELETKRHALCAMASSKPEPPIVPRLIFQDATIQALTAELAKYPSGGILTAEGGAFFGGAGFQSDQIIGAFSLFNELWTGSPVIIDRKSEGTLSLDQVALMLNIAVQPSVISKFLAKTGELAKGSGFLARCLLAMPETTQGQRPYKPPPSAGFPQLAAFNERIKALLALQPNHIEDRQLKRTTLALSKDAQQVWVKYHDAVERSMGLGGESEFIRAEAGKSADNASRLAGIFHIIEQGLESEISPSTMRNAAEIAEWFLSEAKRYMGLVDTPPAFSQASAISRRLVAYCQKQRDQHNPNWHIVTQRELLRYCRVQGVQDRKSLAPVLEELLAANHLLGVKDEGRTRKLYINPKLVGAVC